MMVGVGYPFFIRWQELREKRIKEENATVQNRWTRHKLPHRTYARCHFDEGFSRINLLLVLVLFKFFRSICTADCANLNWHAGNKLAHELADCLVIIHTFLCCAKCNARVNTANPLPIISVTKLFLDIKPDDISIIRGLNNNRLKTLYACIQRFALFRYQNVK